MTQILYWIWLTVALGFSSGSVHKVLYKFTPELAHSATREMLVNAGIDEKIAEKLSDKSLDRARKIIDKCTKSNINIVCFDSPEYPRQLDRLSDSPCVLYVKGDISCLKGKRISAFIGTRRMSHRGFENAQKIAKELIDSGAMLVSGMADGIDTVSAEVSLDCKKPCVAVLGVDIDKYYPKINERLIDEAAECGAVISEYPPGANARYFATRNRIIVGLSDSVYVIEASESSGALIGARLALKKKIPVYALALDGDSFSGCRELIGLGAIPLNDDFVKSSTKNISKPAKKAEAKKEIPDGITGTRRYIMQRLMTAPMSDNSLTDEGHSISDILIALTELELDGYIKAIPGGKYALK